MHTLLGSDAPTLGRNARSSCSYSRTSTGTYESLRGTVKSGTGLGRFVRQCRHHFKKNDLSSDRIADLNALGFEWSLVECRPKVSFTTRLEQLTQYKEEHGHLLVPNYFYQDGLGSYVTRIRHERKIGTLKLSPDQIVTLNDLGFEWVADANARRS